MNTLLSTNRRPADAEPAHAIPTVERDLVYVPPGGFTMGAGTDDKFAADVERPPHRVQCRNGFLIARHPVTVAEYRQYAPAHADHAPDDWPVVNVSWHEAIAYCAWLTSELGMRFRLPSESEWEYACRAGTSTPFHTGDDIAATQANFLYAEDGKRTGLGRRMAVDYFPANAFGLCDLHGNVCEWVADAWHQNYLGAPTDGSVWLGRSAKRVIRGGAWDHMPRLLRSSWRDGLPADTKRDNVGFRVAADCDNRR